MAELVKTATQPIGESKMSELKVSKSLYEASFGFGIIAMSMIKEKPLSYVLAGAVSCFSHKNAVDFIMSKLNVDLKTAKVLLLHHCWCAGEETKRKVYKNLTGKEFSISLETLEEVTKVIFKTE